jgi:hypothetical protein
MVTSNDVNSTWVQRGVILAIVGVLLVAGAYIWGNRLSADTQSSLSQAGQYRGAQGVAGVRQLDAAESGSASRSAEFNSLSGVASVRQLDAAAVGSASGPAEFDGSSGVAGVRALDAALSATGPDSRLQVPRWAGLSVPQADGPSGRGGRSI